MQEDFNGFGAGSLESLLKPLLRYACGIWDGQNGTTYSVSSGLSASNQVSFMAPLGWETGTCANRNVKDGQFMWGFGVVKTVGCQVIGLDVERVPNLVNGSFGSGIGNWNKAGTLTLCEV